MVKTSFESAAPWLAVDGPESDAAVTCQCTLVRNVADFVFPARCMDDERQTITERVTARLQHLGMLESGTYFSLPDLDFDEILLLAERRLIPYEVVVSTGPRGVYISDDQCTVISVNGADHVCASMMASGLQLPELWRRLNVLDDDLGGALGYAFHERFGYLTSSLAHVGTGLKASVILHLPVLTMTGRVRDLASAVSKQRQALYGFKPTLAADVSSLLVRAAARTSGIRPNQAAPDESTCVSEGLYGDLTGALYGHAEEAHGDLYLLTNTVTLGSSEEEILFHLRHTAAGIVAQEKEAREALMREAPRQLEDRVARALGLTRSVRLLGFGEGVSLLSSIRLGIASGLIDGYTLQDVNELLFASQPAHLRMKTGRDCDEWTLNIERADLFRARFSQEG